MNLLAEIRQYVVIVNKKNEVLWMQSAGGKNKLMFPGGTMEEGESASQAIRREIMEETNLDVKFLIPMLNYLVESKQPKQFAVYYLGIEPTGDFRLSHEHTAAQWIAPDKVILQDLAHPGLLDAAKLAVMLSQVYQSNQQLTKMLQE